MKLTKRDTLLLLVVALVAGVGGIYWLYVKPAKEDLDAKRAEVARVETENDGLRDTLARLAADSRSLTGTAAQRLRYAKAVPDSAQVPGAIYQIQRLADRSGVRFDSITTQDATDVGGFVTRTFQIKVTGRFFDVDDFLYRLHRQVTVDAKGRARIGGRLFAVKKLDITAAEGSGGTATGGGSGGTQLKGKDEITATLDIVAFSTARPGAAPAAGGVPGGIVSPNIGQASAVATGGTP
ncbi:MAG: type II secretion system protein GspM [Actinomycetota bacterium]